MIEFNGIDIVAQRRPEDIGVRRALSTTLGVSEERVALIEDVSDYPDAGAADVVCMISSLEGEFTTLLSIQAEALALPYDMREQLMQRLCDHLDTQLLVPDDEVNPYVMWLIAPGVEPRKIGLDTVAFAEGRYVVARQL